MAKKPKTKGHDPMMLRKRSAAASLRESCPDRSPGCLCQWLCQAGFTAKDGRALGPQRDRSLPVAPTSVAGTPRSRLNGSGSGTGPLRSAVATLVSRTHGETTLGETALLGGTEPVSVGGEGVEGVDGYHMVPLAGPARQVLGQGLPGTSRTSVEHQCITTHHLRAHLLSTFHARGTSSSVHVPVQRPVNG
jgi:hypothetical protein